MDIVQKYSIGTGNLSGGNDRLYGDAKGARIVVYHDLSRTTGIKNNYEYASPLS
jgi:hypothetical protein